MIIRGNTLSGITCGLSRIRINPGQFNAVLEVPAHLILSQNTLEGGENLFIAAHVTLDGNRFGQGNDEPSNITGLIIARSAVIHANSSGSGDNSQVPNTLIKVLVPDRRRIRYAANLIPVVRIQAD